MNKIPLNINNNYSPISISLRKLLKDFFDEKIIPDVVINGIELDSRKVKKGDLFFAYPGNKVDGRDYIDQAIRQGAIAVIKECVDDCSLVSLRESVPILSVKDLIHKVSQIGSIFFGHPSKAMTVIGVTGTNGKTSCCHLIAEALELLQNNLSKKSMIKCNGHSNKAHRVGIIGTLGNGFINQLSDPNLTTPDPITVQKLFYEFCCQDVATVVMEASSHALEQGRVDGVYFDCGLFTNLTHEHLDYHKNMTSYGAVKRLLFEMKSIRHGVFNIDDPIGLQWLRDFHDDYEVCGYSLGSKQKIDLPVVTAKDIQLSTRGITIDVSTPWGTGVLKSCLLGRFNVSNLLAVLTTLCLLGNDFKEILRIMPLLHSVSGRMQTFGGEEKPLVVVDFSHTPDALKQSLLALREHCSNKLFCVFGCGGDRDTTKRPMMAKIAEQIADQVIVTNDNVRFEDPEKIVSDILEGFEKPNDVFVEQDRAKAIALAIAKAEPDDIVLIAGKGHENYQIIGDKKTHYSDIEEVQKHLRQ